MHAQSTHNGIHWLLLFMRGTTAAAASAAALATSGKSVTYTSSVKLVREWPSRAVIYFVSSFAALHSEAAP